MENKSVGFFRIFPLRLINGKLEKIMEKFFANCDNAEYEEVVYICLYFSIFVQNGNIELRWNFTSR